MLHWLREYALEWQLTDARNSDVLQAKVKGLAAAVNSSDIVCFVKPGGLCPFCRLATSILVGVHREAKGSDGKYPAFTLHLADLFNEDREALRRMLDVPVLTWPVIFIHGVHLQGGGNALAALNKEPGALATALGAAKMHFVPSSVHHEAQPRPLLLHQAGGGQWKGCQQRIYGNVLRVIAVLQICILAAAYEFDRAGMRLASVPLLSFLALDSLLFTLAGPTPWTPLGCLATVLIWHRRGTVAPLVPYKVTFGALYFLLNVLTLACRLADDAGSSKSVSGGNSTTGAESPSSSGLCDHSGGDGLIWTMLTNSAILAIFRF